MREASFISQADFGLTSQKVEPEVALKWTYFGTIVRIRCSFNNTHVTRRNHEGSVLYKKNCGSVGFSGSKRTTTYASQVLGEDAGKWYREELRREVTLPVLIGIEVDGAGPGKTATLRSFRASLHAPAQISFIRDVTGTAHGGVRKRNPRRT